MDILAVEAVTMFDGRLPMRVQGVGVVLPDPMLRNVVAQLAAVEAYAPDRTWVLAVRARIAAAVNLYVEKNPDCRVEVDRRRLDDYSYACGAGVGAGGMPAGAVCSLAMMDGVDNVRELVGRHGGAWAALTAMTKPGHGGKNLWKHSTLFTHGPLVRAAAALAVGRWPWFSEEYGGPKPDEEGTKIIPKSVLLTKLARIARGPLDDAVADMRSARYKRVASANEMARALRQERNELKLQSSRPAEKKELLQSIAVDLAAARQAKVGTVDPVEKSLRRRLEVLKAYGRGHPVELKAMQAAAVSVSNAKAMAHVSDDHTPDEAWGLFCAIAQEENSVRLEWSTSGTSMLHSATLGQRGALAKWLGGVWSGGNQPTCMARRAVLSDLELWSSVALFVDAMAGLVDDAVLGEHIRALALYGPRTLVSTDKSYTGYRLRLASGATALPELRAHIPLAKNPSYGAPYWRIPYPQ